MNFRDVELLSEYLDGRLSPSDSARLKSRLESDAGLRAVMDDLRSARGLLRKLPRRSAPRDFTLTPKMAGLRAPEPRAYPTFRFAAVLAAFLFVVTIAVNGFAPLAARHLAAAPAPVYGYGVGGGGGPSESAPAATEAPLQSFAAGPTETPLAAQDNAGKASAPTQEIAPQVAPLAPANSQRAPLSSNPPVPGIWQIILGAAALISGAAAWSLRLRNERSFRKRWEKK